MEITNIIIKARKDAKMTIGQAAKIINVSRQLYSKYEKEGTIPLDKYLTICKRLGLVVLVLPAKNIIM